MFPQQRQQSAPRNIPQLQEQATSFIFGFCSIFTLLLEMLLRPAYGSQYFSSVNHFLTFIVLLVFSAFSEIPSYLPALPFLRYTPPPGLYGIGSLFELFVIISFIHGCRTWRRMVRPEAELNSYYVGPPLPFFRFLPFTWWTTRIIGEPLFVIAVAIVLRNLFILTPSATNFLIFSAICLAMKSHIMWFSYWQFKRNLLDSQNLRLIIARITNNTATEEERTIVNMAMLPTDISEDLRAGTADSTVRPAQQTPKEQTNDQETA